MTIRRIVRRITNSQYIYGVLAVFVLAVAFADLKLDFGLVDQVETQTYDQLMVMRYRHEVADDRILIVDIDEGSLARLRGAYGGWPWPRNVMAATAARLREAGAEAVVFDIGFFDPDPRCPRCDAELAGLAASDPGIILPALLIHEAQAPSGRRLDGLHWAQPLEGASQATSAAIHEPYFSELVRPEQIGLFNASPDDDGVIRRVHTGIDIEGWHLPSLWTRVAGHHGALLPPSGTMLLNWRIGPNGYSGGAYPRLPFVELRDRVAAGVPIADGLQGRVVVIGSSAKLLGDIKPTAASPSFPGVEILANAIDNALNGDYYRTMPDWFPLAVATPMIILLAWLFRNQEDPPDDLVIGAAALVLLGITYAAMNETHYYVDFSGPLAITGAFYLLAKIVSLVDRAIESNLGIDEWAEEHRGDLAHAALLRMPGRPQDPAARRKLRDVFMRLRQANCFVEPIAAQDTLRGVYAGAGYLVLSPEGSFDAAKDHLARISPARTVWSDEPVQIRDAGQLASDLGDWVGGAT